MLKLTKKAINQIWAFICDQHLVLFFTITISLKLIFFSTYVIRVTWAQDQYNQGIFFSFLTAALIFAPIYFIRKHKNVYVVVLAFVLSIILFLDTIYFSYFESLPTVGLLGSVGQVKDIGPAIIDIYQWNYLLYLVDVMVIIIFLRPITRFFRKLRETRGHVKSSIIMPIIITVAFLWLLTNQFYVIGINRLSETFNRGFDTKTSAQLYGVLGAHVIDITRFIKQELTHPSAEQEQAIINWVKDNKPAQAKSKFTGVAAKKNVIMIQVESLGGFVINQKVNGKEITPNLNKLIQNSQFFPENRFMIGAGHTSDADFVANTSYFPLPDAAIFVRYGQGDFTSLPKTLLANGYSTFAYHGFNRNFWNRNVALESLGYQKFYAADNFPNEIKINMGLNDGDFLSSTADYIKKQPKPSLNYVITLTSHVPFEITNLTKDLGVNPADYPQQVGGYLENINYTDRMLGKFFEKLKTDGLYDDSLIVIYGDHTPVLPAFNAGSINYDPSTVQGKEVPLFFKLPTSSNIPAKTFPKQATNLDIAPTILDLLGVKTNQLMFGQSLFVEGSSDSKVCIDQLVAFPTNNDCESMLDNEKTISETIVRYNLFNILSK
jgi:phosphoglycerol transferase MdoB-like AlkP superfamily enzyme